MLFLKCLIIILSYFLLYVENIMLGGQQAVAHFNCSVMHELLFVFIRNQVELVSS